MSGTGLMHEGITTMIIMIMTIALSFCWEKLSRTRDAMLVFYVLYS